MLAKCFCFRFEYLFNFDNAFEIHNDIEILKRMGVVSNDVLDESVDVTEKELDEIKTIIPKSVGDNVSSAFHSDFIKYMYDIKVVRSSSACFIIPHG